ncbi:hypothetical protein Bca101_024626 [Brassica carinata]
MACELPVGARDPFVKIPGVRVRINGRSEASQSLLLLLLSLVTDSSFRHGRRFYGFQNRKLSDCLERIVILSPTKQSSKSKSITESNRSPDRYSSQNYDRPMLLLIRALNKLFLNSH